MPLSGLNSEQKSASLAKLGRNLVIASAGTGKTSTIVGRIAHLLNSGVEPSKILLLTFTNKASGEMISRLEKHFNKSIVSKIESGTFHAVSYRWLKKRYPKLSLKQPSELKTLFRSVYEKRNFKRLSLDFEPFSSVFLYDQYNLYQNASLDGFDVWFLEKYEEHESLMDIYLHIIEEFEREKEEYNFASFNDLLLKMRDDLVDNPIEFEEILVDEYQDTNTLQISLIDTLNPKSLFCVGDYDQSIYAFNGANIENISTFTTRYNGAEVFTLKTNYRSTARILSLANKVIQKNERIYPKKLEVGRTGHSYSPILLSYNELFEQYKEIASKIKKSLTPNDDIAVIFRNNSSADGIEASLREAGIPCRRKGGKSFFEAREIKFLLDLMALLVNQKDMMAFIHIFEFAKGIGSALSKEFFQSLTHFGENNLLKGLLAPTILTLPKLNPHKNRQLGLFDDDLEIGSASRFISLGLSQYIMRHPLLKHPRLNKDGALFFEEYYKFMKSIKNYKSPSTILKKAISSDLYKIIIEILSTQRSQLKSGEIDKNKKEQSKERIDRKARLLLELATHYNDLDRFVNAMVLGGSELSEGSGVNLLTVHASKGLEFTDVYVVDLMDNRFPNRKLMSRGGSIEEERRLFYVAVTRAKDRLFLSMAKRDIIKKIDFEPSLFLYEAELVKDK